MGGRFGDAPDPTIQFETSLIGRGCVVTRREYDWAFSLTGGVGIAVAVPWRIVAENRIAFASVDDGQLFGSSSPLDGEAAARRLLGDQRLTEVVLDRQTADLILRFGPAMRIDVFNNSLAHEGWQATYFDEDGRWSLIALGGGDVAFMRG